MSSAGLKRLSIYVTKGRLKAGSCVEFWAHSLSTFSVASLQSDDEPPVTALQSELFKKPWASLPVMSASVAVCTNVLGQHQEP